MSAAHASRTASAARKSATGDLCESAGGVVRRETKLSVMNFLTRARCVQGSVVERTRRVGETEFLVWHHHLKITNCSLSFTVFVGTRNVSPPSYVYIVSFCLYGVMAS